MDKFGIEPLIGAYGRDYKSKKAAQADFDNGLDFVTSGGQYISKTDLVALGVRNVAIRYNKLRNVFYAEVCK